MSLTIPLRNTVIKSGSIDSVYTNRFPDMVKWVESLTLALTIGVRGRTEVLICNPHHVLSKDPVKDFRSYGWRGHQDGIVFTSGGDNIHLLFRDGVVYSTFGGILLASSPTMLINGDREYVITYPQKRRGFTTAENNSHSSLLNEWQFNLQRVNELDLNYEKRRKTYPWVNTIALRK
jgi:hypothetical protein